MFNLTYFYDRGYDFKRSEWKLIQGNFDQDVEYQKSVVSTLHSQPYYSFISCVIKR